MKLNLLFSFKSGNEQASYLKIIYQLAAAPDAYTGFSQRILMEILFCVIKISPKLSQYTSTGKLERATSLRQGHCFEAAEVLKFVLYREGC